MSRCSTNPGIATPPPRRAWIADVTIIALIVVAWQAWLYPEVMRKRPVVFDTYRDAAGAENALAGRWFDDPMTAGRPYWYAPLGPIVFAGVSWLTGQPPLAAYGISILWFNLLLPIGWYALARACWGWRAGVAAVPLIWIGSRWWSFHVTMPMTSTQGVVLLLGVLLAWAVTLRRSAWWAIGVGVLLAACTWYHTLSGVIAAGAIGCHALLGVITRRRSAGGGIECAHAGTESVAPPGLEVAGASEPRTGALGYTLPPLPGLAERGAPAEVLRMLIVAAVGAICLSPLVWHLLSLRVVNAAPLQYVSALLRDPEFALQTRTWLVYPLALVGLVTAWRDVRRPVGIVLAYAVVSFLGQAWGYLRVLGHLSVPVLIPHEFQWNFQIALGLLAAGGALHVADRVARRIERRAPGTRVSRLLLMVPLVALVVQADAASAVRRKSVHWKSTVLSAGRAPAVGWIRQHTAIDDVILASELLDYTLVAGYTGRKIVCPPEGHTNPGVSFKQRAEDRRRMFAATDPVELRRLLSLYGVRYVLLADEDVARWDRWRPWGLFTPVAEVSSSSLLILHVQLSEPTGVP